MNNICIKCAKCNPVCPTFLESYDEVYSPRGYLHLCELMGQQAFQSREEILQILSTCTQCGDCEPLCPIDLPIVKIISETLSCG